jgi:hypothetical protein
MSAVSASNPHLGRGMLLHLAVKATSGTQGLNGLAPSMLVPGTIPRFPVLQSDLPNQRDRLDSVKNAQAEINNIIAEQRIQEAMMRKVTPATDYILKPGQPVRVYREEVEAWFGPFSVRDVVGKKLTVSNSNGKLQESHCTK